VRRAGPAIALAIVVGVLVYMLIAWLGFVAGPSPSPAASAALPTSTQTLPPASSAALGSPRTSLSAGDGSPAPTAPLRSETAVLVGAGDIADCGSNRDSATADLVEAIDGTVFTLGDNAYESGTAAEFRECYGPTWGRRSILERTRPTAGNHDYETAGAAGYFGYFGDAAGKPNEGWYAYDAGAWRIYVLNSNCSSIGGCDRGSRQERWLRADLAANPRTCALAMWHHPRFSSSEHGNDPKTADLWATLQDSGAELVLVGHDHDYERFAPQTASGRSDPEHGLVEIVVGTGGRTPYEFRTIRDNSLVRASGVFGVLRLDLSVGAYAFEFVPVAGEPFTDAGLGACH
jgi:calcineurin-like phosphoesterase family protein